MHHFLVIHTHRYGQDTYIFKSDASNVNELPDNKMIVKAFDIDFEPLEGEELDVHELLYGSIKYIPAKKPNHILGL